MTPSRHRVPDLLLERYLDGELGGDVLRQLEQNLADSDELRGRVEMLRKERAEFLLADPPERFAHRVAARIRHEDQGREPGALWRWLSAPSFATALVVLLTFGVVTQIDVDAPVESLPMPQQAAPEPLREQMLPESADVAAASKSGRMAELEMKVASEVELDGESGAVVGRARSVEGKSLEQRAAKRAADTKLALEKAVSVKGLSGRSTTGVGIRAPVAEPAAPKAVVKTEVEGSKQSSFAQPDAIEEDEAPAPEAGRGMLFMSRSAPPASATKDVKAKRQPRARMMRSAAVPSSPIRDLVFLGGPEHQMPLASGAVVTSGARLRLALSLSEAGYVMLLGAQDGRLVQYFPVAGKSPRHVGPGSVAPIGEFVVQPVSPDASTDTMTLYLVWGPQLFSKEDVGFDSRGAISLKFNGAHRFFDIRFE